MLFITSLCCQGASFSSKWTNSERSLVSTSPTVGKQLRHHWYGRKKSSSAGKSAEGSGDGAPSRNAPCASAVRRLQSCVCGYSGWCRIGSAPKRSQDENALCKHGTPSTKQLISILCWFVER
jgi:hypothetical protein